MKHSSMLNKISFHDLASRERRRQCHSYGLQGSALVTRLMGCIMFWTRVDGL